MNMNYKVIEKSISAWGVGNEAYITASITIENDDGLRQCIDAAYCIIGEDKTTSESVQIARAVQVGDIVKYDVAENKILEALGH